MPRLRGSQAYALPASVQQESVQTASPTLGSTVTILPATTVLVLTPLTLLATLTVTLPNAPTSAGRRITICSTQAITLLTLNPGAGNSIVGGIATLALAGFASYVYSGATWVRCG